MFYRMTRLHWDKDRNDDLNALAESLRARMEAIEGMQFAELVATGEGEGMIIAAYEDESDYRAGAEVAVVEASFADMLTSKPHGHHGTVVVSYGAAPSRS